MEYINTVDKVLKQNAHVLNLLRFHSGIERSEISRRLQISMPTVYKAIDDLSNCGIIKKNENSISINNKYAYLIGISIGSALCKVSFLNMSFDLIDSNEFIKYKEVLCQKIIEKIVDIDYDNELLIKCKEDINKNYIYFKTPTSFSELKNVLDCIFEFIQSNVLNNFFKVISIGISCTGVINYKSQTILSAHNLDYLNDSTLETLIFPDKQQFFSDNQIYVSLVQNSDASVISEKINLYQIDSVYKDRQNIISLYLGVGIGAGIYLDKLYVGTNGYSGEIGHTKAPKHILEDEIENESINDSAEMNEEKPSEKMDETCTCGSEGCYDYKIRRYVFAKNKTDFCDLSSDSMRKILEKNPKKAELFGTYLGNIVNTLTSLLDVDLIIFTGKFYKYMDLLYKHIVSVQDQNKLKYSRNDCTLLTSTNGSLAPSIGAAIYSYHKRFNLDLSWNYSSKRDI